MLNSDVLLADRPYHFISAKSNIYIFAVEAPTALASKTMFAKHRQHVLKLILPRDVLLSLM